MTRCQQCFGELSNFAVFCPNCAQVHEPDLAQLLNQTVGDRYKLYRHLGQGGLSTVFAATDLQTDSVLVVKVSDPAQLVRRELTYAIDAEAARNYWYEMLERMRREAEALTGIDHPNIVRFFDTGMIGDDLRFVAMEFLRGRMLREELDARGRLEIAEAADIALQLCAALGEVHARGIVHRDISPRNVMIADSEVSRSHQIATDDPERTIETVRQSASGQSGRNPQSAIKLIDFGIAKFPQPPGAPPFTQHSVLSGTVAYASPEQCQNRSVDQRSDIYSMGVMLYEMLTGERPFTGRTPTEIAIKHLQADPPSPRQVNPAIPVNLEKIILRALAKNPEDRQQSIQELADELQSSVRPGARQVVIPLGGEQSPDFHPEGLAAIDRLTLVRRRRRRLATAAALLLALAVGGAIFGKNWLASRALPLFAGAPELAASPLPSPEGAVASDSDSLELAAQLSGNPMAGSALASNPPPGGVSSQNSATPSSTANQPAQSPGSQSVAQVSGNGSSNTSSNPPAKQSGSAQEQISEAAKAKPQNQPAPTPAVAANRTPQQNTQSANQPASQPDTTQTPRKSEERKIRQRDAEDSASTENGSYSREETPTARRDRIATNRSRDEENTRRQSDSRPDTKNEDGDGDDRETANRQDSEQIGPKLIQWSGKVNGEREVVIDLPGTPGSLEVPRVYRKRVGIIEPPSASNRWRCVRLRVFGEGGISFVVRWWPRVAEFTRLVGSK